MKNMKIVMMAFIAALGLLSFTAPHHDHHPKKENSTSKKAMK